jgi:hypothetical protein
MRRNLNPSKDPDKVKEKKEKKEAKEVNRKRSNTTSLHSDNDFSLLYCAFLAKQEDETFNFPEALLGCRSEMIKKLSWTYGLGFGVVSVLVLCVYSLFTISRAGITTVALDNADQLKEVTNPSNAL